MSDWRFYAVRLADQLRASGDFRSPAWHAAIAETPRHVLVPRSTHHRRSSTVRSPTRA